MHSADPAGRLIYNYYPRTSASQCHITIETVPGYHIGYAFQNTIGGYSDKCTSFIIHYDNGYTNAYYCGNNPLPRKTQITRTNTLTLLIEGDENTDFMIDMLFVSFSNGSCEKLETRCNGLLGDSGAVSVCIDYILVCDRSYTFCVISGTSCSDIASTSGANNTAVVVTTASIGLVCLIGLIVFACGYLKGRRASQADVRTRAMNIFTTQLTSRGVDGNDNSAYSDEEGGPVDFSKFDPPPEYGSLEHLDNVTVTGSNENGNTDEILPSYGDVMKNFDDYTITTQV